VSVEISGRAGDDCDALVSVTNEVLHDVARTASVVDVHGVERAAAECAVQKDDRMAVGEICEQRFGVDVR